MAVRHKRDFRVTNGHVAMCCVVVTEYVTWCELFCAEEVSNVSQNAAFKVLMFDHWFSGRNLD